MSAPASIPQPPSPTRIASIDALRGFIMFAMVFVNDIAGVKSAPPWMKHFHPDDGNGMTFVDLVFPAFLFIVGLSIPPALRARLEARQPAWQIAFHLLTRTAWLLALGILTVNVGAARIAYMRPGLWAVLMYTAAIAAVLQLPRTPSLARTPILVFKALGIAALIALAVIFRDKDHHWLRTQWWGILGLIGWAYLFAAAAYVPLRRSWPAIATAALALMSLWYLDRWGWFAGTTLANWIDIGSQWGSQAAITTAGVVLGTFLLQCQSPGRRLLFALGLCIAAVAMALCTYEPYGINKNVATPSWCFWSIAITTALWAAFYVSVDLIPAPISRWSWLFLRGGQNVLLAYLGHALFIWTTICFHFNFHARLGAMGLGIAIARSLAVAAILLAASALLGRLGVRLRL